MRDKRRLPIVAALLSVALPLTSLVQAKPTAAPKPTASATPKPTTSAAPTPSPSVPPPPPPSVDEAEARRHFETGLKLYKEKIFEAALVEFEQSYKIIPRPSALRNVAQCHRDLKRFAEAYVVFDRLLATHGPQLTAPELAAVKKALKDLESVTGTIAFTVSETGAIVLIDGREIGPSPLPAPVRIDVGPHFIRVSKAGYEPFEQTLKVLAMQSVSIDAKLVKDIKTGTVTIKEKGGQKVTVVVDDVERGPAPWTGELTPGAHIVELRGEGLVSSRRTIEVAAKSEKEHVLEATALRGRLRVETLGKKGKIYIDGKFVQEGIWEGELAPGAHRIKVTAEGYQPHERLIAIEHGSSVVEAVTLVAIPAEVKPVVAPPVGPAVDPYRGLYGRFALFGAFSMTGAGEEARPTCETPGRPCSSFEASSPMGAGATLHVGHSWGVIGAEFVGAFLFDVHQTKRNYDGVPPSTMQSPTTPAGTMPREETWDYYAFAGFAGLGGRVTSRDDAVRFTFGVAVGGVYRGANVKRSTLDDGWKPGAATYFAPALMADAGLLLGSTPGFKMSIGAAAWIDFPSGDLQSNEAAGGRPVSADYGGGRVGARLESPPQLLRSGTQIYIGPTLGFQFGR